MFLFCDQRTSKKPTVARFFRRHLYTSTFRILVISVAASLPVYAAEQVGAELTMKEAVNRSLSSHPELVEFGYRMKSADGDIKQAAVGQKTDLSLLIEDAFGSGDYSNFKNAKSTLGISWILEGRLLDRRVSKFEIDKSLIDIEQNLKVYDVAAETAHQFVAVLSLQERLVIASKAQQHNQKILAAITKRVDAGKAPLADKLRAEVNLERRELEVEDINHELKSAKKILSSMWGATDIGFSTATGSMLISDELIDYEVLEIAIENNPRMRYFITQKRLAESEISLAKESAKNRLRFNAGVSRYQRTDDYGLLFGVTVPLGRSSRNNGQVSALMADKDRYQASADATKIQLLTQIFVLYEELKHSRHIHDSLENKIVPRLERALQETHNAYQLGKYSYQEWSVVQQEVLDAQLALVDARLAAQNKTIELERLTGLSLLRDRSKP